MKNQQKVAVLDGVRTPFVKAGTKLSGESMQDLGKHVIKELREKSGVKAEEIDGCIFSTVLLDPSTPNWAREMVFDAGLPKSLYAYSVSNNCISGLVAASCAVGEIRNGTANPALLFKKKGSEMFLKLSRARTFGDKLKLLANFRPGFALPEMPSVAEPSTGLTMGQHMEITAKELSISREEQDEIAFASHDKASKAIESGLFDDEVVEIAEVKKDTLVRKDTSIEKLKKLRPVFDRSETGTLTAGNSSALTDGASAVLLAGEESLSSLGKEPLAWIKDFEYSAIDPDKGLLMAPGIAVPRLLTRNKLGFDDFDMIEVHEAFGAQVAANIKAWEEGLMEKKVGKLDRKRLNMFGGSIALGHPFAATGGRIITTAANQLKKNNWKRALISICAAGAMAGAMILERD